MLAFTFDIIAVVFNSWADRRQPEIEALSDENFLA